MCTWVEWVSENVMGCDHWFFSLVTWLKMKLRKFLKKCNLLVQCVFAWFVESTGDEDSHDQSVDSDNTSHDNRNDRFHNQLRSHDTHRSDSSSRLGGSVGSTESYIEASKAHLNKLGLREWQSSCRNFEQIKISAKFFHFLFFCADNSPLKMIAAAAPITPKKGP